MRLMKLAIILAITLATYVSCQDQNTLPIPPGPSTAAVVGQLCISECDTCPVICSSSPPSPPSPSTPTVLTPLLPPSPMSPPRTPKPPPPDTIQPLLPPSSQLPPLLPIQPPSSEGYQPPLCPKAAHHPPPPSPRSSSSDSPKSSGGGSYTHSPPTSPSVSFPLVIDPAGPSPPNPYYYFYGSSAAFSSLTLPVYFSITSLFVIHMPCLILV